MYCIQCGDRLIVEEEDGGYVTELVCLSCETRADVTYEDVEGDGEYNAPVVAFSIWTKEKWQIALPV